MKIVLKFICQKLSMATLSFGVGHDNYRDGVTFKTIIKKYCFNVPLSLGEGLGVRFKTIIEKYCFNVPLSFGEWLGVRTIPSSLLLLFILALNSCKKESNVFKSTGPIASEIRSLNSFNRLTVLKNITTYIVQDTVNFVKITCGENLLDGISTNVEGEHLTITNLNKTNWVRSYKNKFIAEVHCKQLVDVRYESSGNLTIQDPLVVDSFFVQSGDGTGSMLLNLNARVLFAVLNTSVADLTVKGKIQINYLFNNAQGFMDTREVENSYTYMRSNSTNDCKVRVKDVLDAEIEYQGNIYYYGNPTKVNLKKTGTGNLIKAD
jgi:hypothetical protein